VVQPELLEFLAHQVAGHGPALSDGVGDRGAGGKHDAATALQQPLGLEEQVGGSLALGGIGQSLDAIEPGGEWKILPPVRFIDPNPLDPQVFESHGLGQAFALLQAFLAAQEPSGKPLDGLLNGFFREAPGAVTVRACFIGYLADRLAITGELALDECRLCFGIDRQESELRLGDDHRVPVSGGYAGHEFVAAGGGEVVLARHQQTGQRVETLELLGELLEDVVGHDDQDFAGQAEPAQLHRRSGHDSRLARADLME
jgi:hypothetical protein